MNPTLAITADRAVLRLSDTAVVTVTVEGAIPLRVEVPKDLLAGASADIWKIAPVDAARTEALPGSRERWVQQYQATPFQPGAGLPLEFNPFRVKAGPAVELVPLSDRPLSFNVETNLVGAKADDVRPATGVEEVPPLSDPPVGLPAVWAIAAAVLLMVVVGVVAGVRRRRQVPPVPPGAEALAALDADPPPLPDRVAEVVRRFLARRFGLPAGTTTTVELLAAVKVNTGWTAERVAELEAILAAGEVAKFAGVPSDPTAVADIRTRARSWVVVVG
jgi:hypothetical protein